MHESVLILIRLVVGVNYPSCYAARGGCVARAHVYAPQTIAPGSHIQAAESQESQENKESQELWLSQAGHARCICFTERKSRKQVALL